MDFASKLRAFIYENLASLDDSVEIADDDNIFELGYVNSLFAIRLVAFIEQEAGIEIDNRDLNVRNFSSVASMVKLVDDRAQA